ncbi:mediator of RNA polymerase II transcription subunit 15a-like [Phalaenopsis equestris]|uniref:mediator of RNA polymerase II transcription subunit 15a-like n=1 Tax=Phalaenopsis equestris TaxID=78828 RepID=UPI0009E41208|nr:mediator of RNA polymerase II transcription subunit 15a-like [Phalaenopsis equestris]
MQGDDLCTSWSMDSTSQTGHNGADWQEEIYLKIQALREAHLAELQKFHLRISQRYEQTEMLPLAKRPDNFEKLKRFKLWLDGLLAFLQISKSSIKITFKRKLPYYEEQILGLLNISRSRGQQQLKHPVGHAQAQSSPQHQPSQVLQLQQHENHGNQVLLSAVTSRMQHGSVTLATLADPATQQNATNSVQSAFELDHVQVNFFGSLQQGSVGSVQQIGVGPLQNSISPAQQTNLNNLYCASMDTTAQTGHIMVQIDWQEEIYLKACIQGSNGAQVGSRFRCSDYPYGL